MMIAAAFILGLVLGAFVIGGAILMNQQAKRREIIDAWRSEVGHLTMTLAADQQLLDQQKTAIDELEHRNRSLDSKAAQAEKKLTNTREHIASVLQQRDFWFGWYHRQVAEHGAAQHFMMAEIELHVKRGSRHPMNPQLRTIIEDFAGVHPAMADAGRPSGQGQPPLNDVVALEK